MRIVCLPPEPNLPTAPQGRQHAPQGRFDRFKDCLRWEFGFTCAFCRVHEAHFIPVGLDGADGFAMMTVEHRIAQSRDTSQIHRYANCFLCCSKCNIAKSDKELVGPAGQRLLEPTADAWGKHFEIELDASSRMLNLRARRGDRDAEFTISMYDMNDPRKSRMRWHRRSRVAELLDEVRRQVQLLARLEPLANNSILSDVTLVAAEHVRDLRKTIQIHLRELRERWLAIPADFPKTCRCKAKLELPACFEQGRIRIEWQDERLADVTMDPV